MVVEYLLGWLLHWSMLKIFSSTQIGLQRSFDPCGYDLCIFQENLWFL